MLTKICTNCNKTFYALKIDDFTKHFHKAKVGKYGFTARCKSCRFELEILPNRANRAEYDRNRRKVAIHDPKPCIVCNTMFVPQKEDINCCSKECTKFKKKVYNKLYMKNGYRKIIKEKRQKEKGRENEKKPYSKAELDYIIKRIDKDPKDIAIKLKRSTNAISKKIAQIKKVNR